MRKLSKAYKAGRITEKEYLTKAREISRVGLTIPKSGKPKSESRQSRPTTSIPRAPKASKPSNYTTISTERQKIDKSSKLPPVIKQYTKMLIDPHSSNSVRRPDSVNVHTALYHSVMELPLQVDFGSVPHQTANFGFVVQPKLGNINATTDGQYKVSYLSWPSSIDISSIDVANPNTFLKMMNGTDPRIDPNITVLTSPPPSSYYARFIGNAGSAFFTEPPSIDTDISRGMVVQFPAANQFKVPPGLYMATLNVVATAAAGIFNNRNNPVGSSASVYPAINVNPDPEFLITGPSGHDRFYQFLIYATSEAIITINTTYSAAYDVDLAIVSTTTSIFSPPVDYGTIKKMRPIAMSCLTTYTGSTLNNSGNIAAYFAPGDAVDESVFSNSNTRNFLSWTNLASLQGAYSGRLSEGAYIWWSPQSVVDSVLVKPSENNSYSYPCFIIAGSYTGMGPVTGTQDLGRIIIDTIYEYTTTSTAFEKLSVYGSQQTVDAIQNISHSCPRVMSNPKHLQFLADWGKWITSYLAKNASNIGAVAHAINTLI